METIGKYMTPLMELCFQKPTLNESWHGDHWLWLQTSWSRTIHPGTHLSARMHLFSEAGWGAAAVGSWLASDGLTGRIAFFF